MPHIDARNLPEDIARRAQAHVAAGHFNSVEDVVRASVEAMDMYHDAMREWLDYLKQETRDGINEIEHGDYIAGSPAELMASIRAELAAKIKH